MNDALEGGVEEKGRRTIGGDKHVLCSRVRRGRTGRGFQWLTAAASGCSPLVLSFLASKQCYALTFLVYKSCVHFHFAIRTKFNIKRYFLFWCAMRVGRVQLGLLTFGLWGFLAEAFVFDGDCERPRIYATYESVVNGTDFDLIPIDGSGFGNGKAEGTKRVQELRKRQGRPVRRVGYMILLFVFFLFLFLQRK